MQITRTLKIAGLVLVGAFLGMLIANYVVWGVMLVPEIVRGDVGTDDLDRVRDSTADTIGDIVGAIVGGVGLPRLVSARRAKREIE
ncbi:MAG: hypothetical protein R2707_05125 [Acidimicrobiales bacterium]